MMMEIRVTHSSCPHCVGHFKLGEGKSLAAHEYRKGQECSSATGRTVGPSDQREPAWVLVPPVR